MLSLSAAVVKEIVRKNLDELNENYSDVLGDTDSEDLDTIIVKSIAQAANHVHEIAPQDMLEGKFVVGSVAGADGVSTFEIKDNDYLRLVRCKPAGSSVYLRTAYNEDSPQGRMQLNPYTRGTSDRPRLVLLQGKVEDYLSSFKYYSLDHSYPSAAQAIERFEYIPRYRYTNESGAYRVSENVIENIIDQLTGMMLVTYNNTDKATYFFTKAGFGQPATE